MLGLADAAGKGLCIMMPLYLYASSQWRYKMVVTPKCARLSQTSIAHRPLIASRRKSATETVFWVDVEKASHKCARLSFMMLVEQCAIQGDSTTRYSHTHQFTNTKSIDQDGKKEERKMSTGAE